MLRNTYFYRLVLILALISYVSRVAAQDPVQSNPGQSDSTPKPSRQPASPPAVSTIAHESINASDPDVSPLHQGIVFFRTKNWDQAATKFRNGSYTTGLEDSIVNAWLSRTELHLHNVDEAERAARKGLEEFPGSAAAKSALAEVYFRQARFEEANNIVRELAKAQTTDPRTYLTLARIYWATANYKSAKASIDRAHALDDKDPDIHDEWIGTLPRHEQLEELKKQLANRLYESEHEREVLVESIAFLEDEEKQPVRTCKLTQKNLPMETKLEPLANDARTIRGFGLQVKINDTSSHLLVDTGSTGILINSRVAEKAGVTKIADAKIGGVGDKGPSPGYIAFANHLQIGSLIFENCYVSVVEKKYSLGEDGLIGADTFDDFLVDLDFPNNRLRLAELPPFPDQPATTPGLGLGSPDKNALRNRWIPPPFAAYQRVFRFGHMLLIPGHINNSPERLFLIDTGSWDNTISPAAAKGFTKIHRDSDMIVKGLNGRVNKVYTAEDVTLTFGHFQQKRDDLTALDMTRLSNDLGVEISGALGFDMLYLLEINIDYRDNLVNFSYDPNRFH